MKWVYAFGNASAEGSGDLKDLLGAKGAGLAQMSRLGLPVPPGFTIITQACGHFKDGYPPDLTQQVFHALDALSAITGTRLGDPAAPLLVAVRSGARVSMPGMMDTVLNLGLNSQTVEGLANISGDPRFAYDSYRRFIYAYADVVAGLDIAAFDEIFESAKDDKGAELDTDLDGDDLKAICDSFRREYASQAGSDFPEDVQQQLWSAIGAVFESWNSARARTWRRINSLAEDEGTAVTIQAMVFGNLGPTSATGVAFTRDPASGEKILYGEFLPNAQGEDVVGGIRNPQPISLAMRQRQGARKSSLEEWMPDAFSRLCALAQQLESHYRDAQDVEFTIQNGQLFLLQSRPAKRTIKAAMKMAVEMVGEGLIEKADALARLDAMALDQLLHPTLDAHAPREEIATGLAASPGAASGEVVFTAEDAVEAAAQNRAVILVRPETSPHDIHGMYAARGVLTARGGLTSHAAVVARGMGRPCVCGATSLRMDAAKGEMIAGTVTIRRGDVITLDGASGKVFKGAPPMRQPDLSGDLATLLDWADQVRKLEIRADADTPQEAEAARRFGADGIGLSRTEHLLAGQDLGDLDALAPRMRAHFAALFRAMPGRPIAIRLFEPPHATPLPGAALGRLYQVQLAAILEAGEGQPARLDILVPLSGLRAGFDALAEGLRATAATFGERDLRIIAMLDELHATDLAGSADGYCLHADDMSDIAGGENAFEYFTLLHEKNARGKLHFSVCGERVATPLLVRVCSDSGFDYVSCLSSRVPIARIVAAQAALMLDTKKP